MSSPTPRYRVAFLASVCLMAGCGDGGPRLGTVTGKVTMNGQPVPRLKINFVPAGKGKPSYGATDENGDYKLMFNQTRAGAILGKHNVTIENIAPPTDESGNLIPLVTIRIPKKYRQPGPLTAEVAAGSNEVDFPLDSTE